MGKTKQRKTITRSELRRMSFCDSPRMPQIVEDDGVLKEWVGIGWIKLKEKPTGREVLVVDDEEEKQNDRRGRRRSRKTPA